MVRAEIIRRKNASDYLSIALLSILYAQGPYTLSFNLSQFEFTVENGYDRVNGRKMSEEYLLDLPLCPRTTQEDISPFGFIRTRSGFFGGNNTDRKSKSDILLCSVEEFLIDTNHAFVNTRGPQSYPSVAFSGINYLIVWADDRDVAPGLWDIYCARCSPEGILLDSSGILISTTTLSTDPSRDDPPVCGVGFDGNNYFVVWHDRRTQPQYYDIIGARVSQSGVVLDPEGILISPAPYMQSYPQVAFDGTNYLVVWHDWRNGTFDVYGARVNPSGIVLDPNGIPILTMPGNQGVPAISFDGINYLVVWEDWRNGNGDVYGARMTQAGTTVITGAKTKINLSA